MVCERQALSLAFDLPGANQPHPSLCLILEFHTKAHGRIQRAEVSLLSWLRSSPEASKMSASLFLEQYISHQRGTNPFSSFLCGGFYLSLLRFQMSAETPASVSNISAFRSCRVNMLPQISRGGCCLLLSTDCKSDSSSGGTLLLLSYPHARNLSSN